MAKGVYISKAVAIATAVLTVSAVCGIVGMIVLYQIQVKINPPVRPTTPIPTMTIPTGPPPTLRLPDSLIPLSYQVFLQPYLYTRLSNGTEQDYVFKGNSTVRLQCVKNTRSIFLHAFNLSISEVAVTHSFTGESLKVERYKVHNNDSNFFEIQLKDVLVGNGSCYDLFTKFEGELGEWTGLYASYYTEKTDEDEDEMRFLVASQMEPIHAREVFPCFDEPALKAVFNITIIHRHGSTALSNGQPDDRIVDIDGEQWIVTTFSPTPLMSTYLLGFTVHQFAFQTNEYDKKPIMTWARPEAVKARHAEYASEITVKILRYFENLFKIKYSLNKLDQIAVPDFHSGGMENWGVTMYREPSLLFDNEESSIKNKEWVASVTAHELAHQWLGNLVTMKWWNNLWLKEGFATYLSYLAVDAVEPQWNIRDLMVLQELQPSLEEDSLNTSRPLSFSETEVETPSEIMYMFNTITYSKGAAVLRMLSAYMGETNFLEGLQIYLTFYQYNSSENEDLWSCMQKATHKDVAGVMKPWTVQEGYPVISINISNGEISQEQFLLNREEDTGIEWQVPIYYMKSNKAPTEDLLKEKGPVRKPVYIIKDDAWLLANINFTGYYRVNYDKVNWNRLLNQLNNNHHAIPHISRGQLIDDAFNLARANYINVTLALNTTKYLIKETEYVPWEFALLNLKYFTYMFDRSEVYGPMQRYLRKQVKPLYEYFQNNTVNASISENLAEQYNQKNAISTACTNGLPECIEMARQLFDDWKNGTKIPPNLRSTIFCEGIAAGDEDDWDFAWQKFEEATIATEKDELRYALSCTKIIWLLNRYLEYTLDPSKIRKIHMVSTISYIANNVAGQALAWDFVRAHWMHISDEYGDDSLSIGYLIEDVSKRFSTAFDLHQLRQFQVEYEEQYDGPGPATPSLEYAMKRTEANIKWVKEKKQTVLNWFKDESGPLSFHSSA
ncbi:alanyl (membrane) aminopeptidase-like b [Trichomycterus rosablanca]|uniref:alanyl (membrane) aminopeptidase-like b n=1 Tax=Trichomycterus rosablanca TaxID=2290929 RepID=UPI002F356737